MPEPLVVVGLLSGGKDSCYNLCHCVKQGHRVAALATLAPPEGKDELDSYMYQTVGHDAVHLISEAMELPLYRGVIRGQALNQTSSYGDRMPSSSACTLDDADETEDLFRLLCEVKAAHPQVNAVSVGAILSNYQRVRVEHVALRAGLQLLPLCYLWQRDQGELLDEMCRAGMESILIKVAGAGLEEHDLGKTLVKMRAKLHKLHDIYGAHICGEGGEYETFTLDCPLFKRRIVIDQMTTIIHSDSSFASVFYLRIDRAHLEDKEATNAKTLDDVKVADLLDPLGKLTMQTCTAAAAAATTTTKKSGGVCTPHPQRVSKADRGARKAYVAKQGRWCAIGSITGACSSNLEEEFASAFDTLQYELHSCNLSPAHLAHLNVYLSSQSHFATLNKVYQSYFGVDPPSRACVAVNMAGGEGKVNLIIDAVAFDDGSQYASGGGSNVTSDRKAWRSRKVLHVQSRSYWAAANIGPYSQSVNADGRITIAGQIGLAPTTLQLVESPLLQIALSLQHARRVFKATLEGRTEKQRGWVEGCICWIDDARWLSPAKAAWRAQRSDDDDDDEEDGKSDNDSTEQPRWESEWLGRTFRAHDVPLCFVVLPNGALPRSAIIEWQLFAHDGKAVTSEGDSDGNDDNDQNNSVASDDDQDGDAAVPAILSGRDVTIAGFSGSYRAISSKQGASHLGIATLCGSPSTATVATASAASSSSSSPSLLTLLSTALSVKVLYHQEQGVDQLEKEMRTIPAATTFLPVCGCYDDEMQACDMLIIWQGVSR